MNTHQLEYIGKRLCKEFNGVVAADRLTPTNGYFIVNVDEQDKPGSHWVCIYFNDDCCELWDPAGNPASKYHQCWEDMMLSHSKRYKYNSRAVQDPLTSTCGQFTLYYLFNRCEGRSMEDIVRLLGNGTEENERRVTQFVSRLVYDM